MGVPPYLCVDGIELSNSRTVAYTKTLGSAGGMYWRDCGGCSDDFYKVDNDNIPYQTPALDSMPWVSPKEPESEDWFGLIITSIDGLDLVSATREVIDRINDGAQFGRQRRPPRVVIVSAISVGRTCTSAWWGVRWLNEVLRESTCAGGSCGGVDLNFFLNCPDFKGSCLIPNTPEDIDIAIAPYKRTLHDVVLSDGVRITDRINLARCQCQGGSCSFPIIEFTLTAGDPHAYTDPAVAVTDGVVFPCAGSGTCPTWVVVADGVTPADPCAETPACDGDPVCGTIPVPPDPPLLRDPCVCDPITLTTTCFDLEADLFSDMGQTVPVFTIKAGADPIRGLAVRFIPRDGNNLSACDTCFEINLPFLPPNATWTFDAAQRETSITCGGQTNAAAVTGPIGGPLTWPVFECVPVDYAMCVTVGCGTDISGLRVNANLVTRHG